MISRFILVLIGVLLEQPSKEQMFWWDIVVCDAY